MSTQTPDWFPRREFRKRFGGHVFPTDGSWDWFQRQHGKELIAAGVLIPRRGRGGDLLHKDAIDVSIEILKRERLEVAQ